MNVINDLSAYGGKGCWENAWLKENCVSGSEGGLESPGEAVVGLSCGIRRVGQQLLLHIGHVMRRLPLSFQSVN